MANHRVLMVGDRKNFPETLPELLESKSQAAVVAEVTSTVSRAMAMLLASGYDAAVVWVEHDHELSSVIRIRKLKPDLPILVLSPRVDPGFEDQARRAGATRTSSSSRDMDAVTEEIGRAVTSGELLSELRAQSRWVLFKAGEVRQLATETRKKTVRLRALLNHPPATFAPLIVEDDQDMILLLTRAFKKAKVPDPAGIFNTGEALMRHLSEAVEDFALRRRPYPSMILLDLELPGKSGLEVVEWIRRQPCLSRLPVIMFSSVSDPVRINRAYQAGVNSYLIKPTDFDSLVEMVRGLKWYWGGMNQPPCP